MTDAQVLRFRIIYLWALALLVAGVAMAGFGKAYLVTVLGWSNDWLGNFPMSLVAPEYAYFWGAIAAIYVVVMLVNSWQLMKMQGQARRAKYMRLWGAQAFFGGFMFVLAVIMVPFAFILPLFSGLVGFSFAFLAFSGAGIHFAAKALNKDILYTSAKSGQQEARTLDLTRDMTSDAPTQQPGLAAESEKNLDQTTTLANTVAPALEKKDSAQALWRWQGGPLTFSSALFLVAMMLVLPTIGKSGSGDLSAIGAQFFAVLVAFMQIGPTIYAAAKYYKDVFVCLGLGLVTIVTFIAIGIR